MALVEFVYNGNKTLVQCEIDEAMKDIIKRFLSKTEIKYENVDFFYDGKMLLEENLSFNKIANELDKNRKQMNIAVINTDVSPYDSFLKKSEYIICPECKELILISIKNHKICLSECKNGHKFEDIPFKDFEQTQYIDESKIKCDKCKKNKNEVYQNLLYICLTCKINLCPLCKSVHDKSHFIIDYEQKDFICHSHLDNYTFCCSDCKKDICALCEIEHKGHKIITYGSIISDKDDLVKNLNNSKKVIIEFKEHIDAIISKLNEVVQNIEDYFNAYSNMINNFNVRNKNYYILQNINYMKEYNKTFINNINDIINDKNIANSVNNIIEIFDKIKYKEPEQPVNNIIDNIKEKEKENIQIQEEEINKKINTINNKNLESINSSNMNNQINLILKADLDKYIKENTKLKEENTKIKDENIKIKDENNKLKEENIKSKEEVENIKSISNISNNIVDLVMDVRNKEKEINELKTKLDKNYKSVNFNEVMVINFISVDGKINEGITCIKTDTFAEVEEKLYQKYPEYREENNVFLSGGNIVKRFKKIYENNIKNGDKVILKVESGED